LPEIAHEIERLAHEDVIEVEEREIRAAQRIVRHQHEGPTVPIVIGKMQRIEGTIEDAASPNVVVTNGEDRCQIAAEGMTKGSTNVEAAMHHKTKHAAVKVRHGAEHEAAKAHREAEVLQHHGGAV